jgi:hypothetical protein
MANQWFRMYSEFAHDPKVQMLSEIDQRRLVMLFCLRCSSDVTLHDDEVTFQLRIGNDDWIKTKTIFLSKGFIDSENNILNWDKRQFISDSSAERVARHREKKKQTSNVTVTSPEQIQNITEHKQKYTPPIPTELLSALMVIRKAKRLGAITEIAYNGMRKQADAAGLSVEQALTIAVERGWGSFNASWDWQDKPNKQNKRDQDLNWFLGNQPAIEKDITHG